MGHDESQQDRNIDPMFDRYQFGRLVRAARIIGGYDNVSDLAEALVTRHGVHLSERTLYAIERGEQEPTVSQYIAIVLTLNPPGGALYWDRCLRPDIASYFQARREDGGT